MYATLLAAAAAAAEKEAPLIDIDGTVVVQFGIFCVMAAVLYALVFKPYLAVREARDRGISGAREEAKGMDARVAAMAAQVESEVQRARQRGADERAKLRAEGAAHEREVLGAAREAANQAISGSRARARAEQEVARAKLLAEAQPLAREVAGRILGRPL